MSAIEDLLSKPEINLEMSRLWTKFCNQAVEENRDACEILAEEMEKHPEHARTFGLLMAWLNSD